MWMALARQSETVSYLSVKTVQFTSLENFCQRTRLPDRLVENLIKAGAFDFCRLSRRNLFWELGRLHYDVNSLGLEMEEDDIELPDRK